MNWLKKLLGGNKKGAVSDQQGESVIPIGMRCSVCGSEIDHFGFNQRDFQVLVLPYHTQKNELSFEERTAWMRTIGGRCSACGRVYCSLCFREQKTKCSNCGSNMPAELH